MKHLQSVLGRLALVGFAVAVVACGKEADPVTTEENGGKPKAESEPESQVNPTKGETTTPGGEESNSNGKQEADTQASDPQSTSKGRPGDKPMPKPTVKPGSDSAPGSDESEAGTEDDGELGSESETNAEGAIDRARRRATQQKEMVVLSGLSKAFRVWSLDEDGAYPPAVDHPPFVEGLGKPELFDFKNATTGKVARPWYMKGTSAESKADDILMASPWVYNRMRSVVYCDSSSEAIPEVIFQEKVAEMIERGGVELVK